MPLYLSHRLSCVNFTSLNMDACIFILSYIFLSYLFQHQHFLPLASHKTFPLQKTMLPFHVFLFSSSSPFLSVSSIYFALAPSSLLAGFLLRFIRPLLSHAPHFPIPFLLPAPVTWPPSDPSSASPTFLDHQPSVSSLPFIHSRFFGLVFNPPSTFPTSPFYPPCSYTSSLVIIRLRYSRF